MIKNEVKILDCTLRDGGYLNNWLFGEKTIKSVLSNLQKGQIDYVECGLLKDCKYNRDKTFFSSIVDLLSLINENQNYTLMVNFGEYSIKNFTRCENPNIKIRVAFKKHNQVEALNYISELKKLGWDVFANPMSTNTYNSEELLGLIKELNCIKPLGVTIVDTLGNMYEDDVINLFDIFDKNLKSDIALGFHSHNSLQLSFSNTKALLKTNFKRSIVIDSCLYGMGRGAGNLCTELITKYLNDNYDCEYKILPLLKSIDNDLKPIFRNSPWGYSTPYYIAASHGCHPNYANYLVGQSFSDEQIDKILFQMPDDKKVIYDKDFIESLANNRLIVK